MTSLNYPMHALRDPYGPSLETFPLAGKLQIGPPEQLEALYHTRSGSSQAPAAYDDVSDSELGWNSSLQLVTSMNERELLRAVPDRSLKSGKFAGVDVLSRQFHGVTSGQISKSGGAAPAIQTHVSGPVRFLLTLLKTWRLQRGDAVSLLGYERSEWRHVDDLLAGRASLTGRDAKDRIAYLFQIRKTLAELFRDEDVENAWLRESHPRLNNQSPMELLSEGTMENVLVVRDYVLSAAGL